MTADPRRRLLAQVLAAEDGYDYQKLVDYDRDGDINVKWLVDKYDRIAGKALEALDLDAAVKS